MLSHFFRNLRIAPGVPARLLPRLLLVGGACATGRASAQQVVTTDLTAVQAFQSGATVLGFDTLPPNGGGGATQGNPGVPVQPNAQLQNQYAGLGILFSSSNNGPCAVVSVQGLTNQADARSPFNLIGGTLPGTPQPTISWVSPVHVRVVNPATGQPSVTDRVGAWNDPTGSRIRLSVYDSAGALLEQVMANQGFFVGIHRAGIASATFEWVQTQGAVGFSLDDVTVGPSGPTCDSIDFNGDGLFPDTADIEDFLRVFSGGTCSNDPNCGDIDFNNDGLFPDTLDIEAFLSVFSGGPCV